MSITTYDELQTAITNWLGGRSDLTSYYPDWIVLFEREANKRLRVRKMETNTTLTPSAGSVSLPTDYLAWRRVTWQGSPLVELEYVHPSYLQQAYPSTPTGTPALFAIESGTLKIRPTSTTGIDFLYYQSIPPLASNNPNWLLTAHPDMYLFGSLAEAGGFVSDDAQLLLWKTRRDDLIAETNALDADQKDQAK